MERKTNRSYMLPALFFAVIAGFVVWDLLYKFGNYDTPFLFVFSLYIVYILFTRASSRQTFAIAGVFLIGVGLSYFSMGPVRLTERFGEWWYLFFVFGLVQSGVELWNQKKA